MTQNDGSDYRQDHARKDSDPMETLTPGPGHPTDGQADSPTSATDAGLSDALLEETSVDGGGARRLAELADADPDAALELEEAFRLEDADLNEGLPSEPREIPLSDLHGDRVIQQVEAPEMSDLSSPGEVDIEELADDALSDTDIPRDALLDPIEE